MHLYKHLAYITGGLLVLGLFYFLAISDMFRPRQIAHYENFIGLSEAFDATENINQATKRYPNLKEGATVIRGIPEQKQKIIALTFDGLDTRFTTEAILDALKEKGWQATFFIEGVNAAHHEFLMQKIVQDKHEIGNYSFVGISKGERLQPDRLIEEFCKTQKALEITAGNQPSLFKLKDTRYLDFLLRAARSSGLQNAVQSDLTVTGTALANGDIAAFVGQIRPGMIVSVELGRIVPIRFTEKKPADKPAIDLQPTIKDTLTPNLPEQQPVGEAVRRFCDRLAQEGYIVLPVGKLGAPVLKPAHAF